MSIFAAGGLTQTPGGRWQRGLAAGMAWGLAMAVALTAMKVRGCGVLCLSDTVVTLVLSLAAGIATLTPAIALACPYEL